MKFLRFLPIIAIIALAACGNKNTAPQTYGTEVDTANAIAATALLEEMGNAPSFEATIHGKIVAVCQEEGCWVSFDMGGAEPLRVMFKDHSFKVPKDINGRDAFAKGIATFDTTSVEDQKHLLADANAAQPEIDAITEPKSELVFEATGILVK